jgi:hypothetical protein
MKGVNVIMKKTSLFAIIIILINCLAGCGGGSSSGGSDKPVTNTDILTLLSNYAIAVDAYDVDGMLKCLDDSASFKLTINDGSFTDTKNYKTLKEELENDENSQLAWRKLPTEDPNGHSYKLKLILDIAYSSNETSTGAVVKQTFRVLESAKDIDERQTDSGNIVWTLVQSSGVWKATAMIINYDYSVSQSAALAVKGTAAMSFNGKGFGFGKVGL